MTDTTPPAEEMVKRLEPIMDALGAHYEPAGAVVWLTTPNPFFGGRIALDMVREGRADDVMDFLQELSESVYT